MIHKSAGRSLNFSEDHVLTTPDDAAFNTKAHRACKAMRAAFKKRFCKKCQRPTCDYCYVEVGYSVSGTMPTTISLKIK